MSTFTKARSAPLTRRVLSIRAVRRAGFTCALALLSACSRVDAPEADANHMNTDKVEQRGGSGTRAKGEEGALAAPETPKEATRGAQNKRYAVQGPKDNPDPHIGRQAARRESMDFGMIGLSGAGAGLAGGSSHGSVAKGATAPTPSAPEREFNTEAYKHIDDNPFQLVTQSPLSTFSIDVDTASYSNMRRFVEKEQVPPKDAIRAEEWINYFHYDDAPPEASEPFRVSTELSACPWAPAHRLLRVALSTQKIAQDQVPPRNLVFLIDVSGSMQDVNKLPLLRRGLALLARTLRKEDTLSIVVYAGASGMALPPTSGAEQGRILGTINDLEAGGSTNGAEGIQLAYRVAQQQFKKGGINRVVLATDGDFNVGVTSEGDLERLIEQKRKSGVFLTVLGFGEGNVKDATTEMLADKGNGNYAYIDSLDEARRVLIREGGATLVTVAKDVKIQVEFNPKRVGSYRLVGYENRLLADRDFNDDTKDAGDIGAGHHVTALYEVTPAGAPTPSAPSVDPLKYQTARTASVAAGGAEMATVKLRYKEPAGATSRLIVRPVLDDPTALARASEDFRFSAAVAEYALSLRGAPGLSRSNFDDAHRLAVEATGPDVFGERHEFVSLMERATKLVGGIVKASIAKSP